MLLLMPLALWLPAGAAVSQTLRHPECAALHVDGQERAALPSCCRLAKSEASCLMQAASSPGAMKIACCFGCDDPVYRAACMSAQTDRLEHGVLPLREATVRKPRSWARIS
ncbi:hypothetical protein FA09DRAFT_329654 [Tilletiopsis washingtonensis]|uniref:Extracellular membrane protein CFEM domain-containing protein n=1 Tax=Tilletiopsis washingtonensis TaxID=58919 RepID=A0A316Z9Y1_9BASI|nr:hypothetical protein FA09DRAFT_329654 [Tilletiopsis washingtonensis]PWN98607.1 hypothetical protein FA09DRAFT_329654 [Tilletiopsis washingtonensis]